MNIKKEGISNQLLVLELVTMLKLLHLAFKDWMPSIEEVVHNEIFYYDMSFNDDRKEEMISYIEALRTIINKHGIRLDLKRTDLDVVLTLESNYYDTIRYLNEYLLILNHHHIKQGLHNGDYIKVYLNFERHLKDNLISNEPVMNIYQKALNQIRNSHKDDETVEACDTLQSLVDKERAQILSFDHERTIYYCSFCQEEVEDEKAQYCMICGQKIKKRTQDVIL